jgi:hemerythrin-like domain-containing protein
MTAAWSAVRAVLLAIAEGHWPRGGTPSATAQWRDFVEMYRLHIELEEQEAYRAALPHFDTAALSAMGTEMSRRRGA